MVDPDLQPLILDPGSLLAKVGFGGDDAPRAVFPHIVGRPRNPGIMVGMDAKDCFVGDEAQAKRGILILNHPVEKNRVLNWNDLEKVFHHSFYNELCVTPEEHPVLICHSPLLDRISREKLTSIMFETFNCPALYLSGSTVLSMHTSGRLSGIAIDCGESLTHIQAIYEGHAIDQSFCEVDVGGCRVTARLGQLLARLGHEGLSADRLMDIKENVCYVSVNPTEELRFAELTGHCETEYELPDGFKISIASERFLAAEILFSSDGKEAEEAASLPAAVCDVIGKCDPDLQDLFSQNVVLCGGSMGFEGMGRRMRRELRSMNNRINVTAPQHRRFGVWVGGSILSSLAAFHKCWISKEDYDDVGATIVHRSGY